MKCVMHLFDTIMFYSVYLYSIAWNLGTFLLVLSFSYKLFTLRIFSSANVSSFSS